MKTFNKVLLLSHFIFFGFNSLSAQIHITQDTNWTTEQYLNQSVIVDQGATLTIDPGTVVNILYVDLDGDNVGDIKIDVQGRLVIKGTSTDKVEFKPFESTSNKSYWHGIVINSNVSNDSLRFFTLKYARYGITVNSPATISGTMIRNTYEWGIKVDGYSEGQTVLNDVDISLVEKDGIVINTPNTFISWSNIDSCGGVGLYNLGEGVTDLMYSSISSCSGSGVFNLDGKLIVSNCYIKKNGRHGFVNTSGDVTLEHTEVNNNAIIGILIGGDGSTNAHHNSIMDNLGSGIEITEWKLNADSTNFIYEGDPQVSFESSNIFNNSQTTVEDSLLYPVFSEWTFDENGAAQWTFWSGIYEIPLGRMTWISYQYIATCNQLKAIDYQIMDNYSNDAILHTFHAGYDPSCGVWLTYPGGNLPPTTSGIYYLRAVGEDRRFQYGLKDFFARLNFGGYEVNNNINSTQIADFASNYWGQIAGIDTLVHYVENPNIDYSGWQIFEITDAHPKMNQSKSFTLTKPVANSSHENNKMLNIEWNVSGTIPYVTIQVSTDLGNNWATVVETLPNYGNYEWYNNLPAGSSAIIKIADSVDESVFSQVVLNVIPNQTPLLSVSPDTLRYTDLPAVNSALLYISNAAGGTLSWSVNSLSDRLSFSETSGRSNGETDTVAVQLNRSGLAQGTYEYEINLQSNGGNQTVIAQVIVAAPSLSFNPGDSLKFGATTTTLPLMINNVGGSTLAWNLTLNQSWLSASALSGSTETETDTIYIMVNRDNLSMGDHDGAVIILSDGGNGAATITMSVVPPQLAVNPAVLGFGESQTEKKFALSNGGTGLINWNISTEQNWISVSPNSGTTNTGPDSITVSIDRTGLAPGDYSGKALISSNAGNMEVDVNISVPQPPVLNVNPSDSLSFGTEVTGLPVIISNTGEGVLSWNLGTNDNWIVLSDSSGETDSETDTITVSVNRVNLTTGLYQGILFISSNTGIDSIDVSMEVINQILVVPTALNFDSTKSQLYFTITNQGAGIANWNVSSDNNWISFSPSSGETTTEVDSIAVEVDRSSLNAGPYTGTIDVLSDAGNASIATNMKVVPKLVLNEDSLDFGSTQTQMTFVVSNSGSGLLAWNAISDESWIMISPNSGTTNSKPDTISVVINWSELSSGNYDGRIKVNSDGGNGEISVSAFVYKPSISITSPANNSVINDDSVLVTFTLGGNPTAAGGSRILQNLKISPQESLSKDGRSVYSHVSESSTKNLTKTVIASGNSFFSADFEQDYPFTKYNALTGTDNTNWGWYYEDTNNNGQFDPGENSYAGIQFAAEGTSFDMWIISESFDGSGATTFSFDEALDDFQGLAGSFEALISYDSGATWNTIWSRNDSDFAGGVENWNRHTLNITVTSQMMIAFRAFGSNISNFDYWFVDNVLVSGLADGFIKVYLNGAHVNSHYRSDPITVKNLAVGSNTIAVQLVDFSGQPFDPDVYDELTVIRQLTTGISDEADVPSDYVLYQAYPNPFNPYTRIKFALPKTDNVVIEIFNSLGQKIRTLLDERMPAGYHEIDFAAHNLPSGIYLYRISTSGFEQTRKVMLLK